MLVVLSVPLVNIYLMGMPTIAFDGCGRGPAYKKRSYVSSKASTKKKPEVDVSGFG
jgi:hypothetical protein